MADGDSEDLSAVRVEEPDGNAKRDAVFDKEEDASTDDYHLHVGYKDDQPLPRRSSLVKDPSRRQHRKAKTVSFSSMPNERTVVNAPDCLNFMINGSELIKVRSNSRQYHRMFTLDPDLQEIRWQPSSKKAHKARIPVSSIKEIRAGKNTDVLRNKDVAGHYPDECAFSVIYGETYESMDLIANTPDEASIWVTGLMCLISGRKHITAVDALEERQQMRDRWLQEVFETADLGNSGELDEREVITLMKKLNNGLATVKVNQKLKEISNRKESTRGRLTSDEFVNLFKEISTRPEIYFLLVRYASTADYMTTEDLLLFLEAEQGMSRVTKDQCLEIINRYEPSKEGCSNGQLGIDGFTAYLLSAECHLFDTDHLQVCQDMSQPLSHYFIASSHNTYLLEDQLKGRSSEEGYVMALQSGCRFIELDCWDGPADEPIIYHGHTLTSKIQFQSVIETINMYAFEKSDYPVILSIENHCSIQQQQTMAHIMKKVFGDKLYTGTASADKNLIPSPSDFKGKIVVKAKKLASDNKESEGYVTDEDEGSEMEKSSKKNNKRGGSVKKHKLAKELSDLVNWCKSIRFQDFQTSQTKQECYEMCSFSESAALKLANAFPEEFVNHNKHFLSRIYPNGMRVDSSNYNPQDLWNCGCQMVSLNYQTPGLMMDLNRGRFLQNGGCGYVLKPAIMREEIAYFSANTREVIPGVSPQILHIKVISGQQLPKPKGSGAKGDSIDPYVSVEIFGIPADCAEERTKTVQHNGYNPLFDESFEFQINLPELALVRFCILDDEFIGDEFIGQYTIPFECMQTGYRHFQLKSNSGEDLPHCTLFVHVAITNKRGGGASGRGLSMRKGRKHRDYTSMKSINVKPIDETFKVAINPLREGTDLRDGVQVALGVFKENCGLAPISNLKQCVRLLASRMNSHNENSSLHVVIKAEYPYFEPEGDVPDILRKALVSFETLVLEAKNLINHADEVYEKLLHARQTGLEWHDSLENLAMQHGIKGKKLNKAVENFAWNIRVLKGQADLLWQAKQDCIEYMKQVKESALSMNILKNDSSLVILNGNRHEPEET